MKKIFTLIAVLAIACSSAFAITAVKLESKGQWAEYSLSDKVPFTFDDYVGYKVVVGEMEGTFQVTMGSVETTPTEVPWSDTPLDISDAILYSQLATGDNVYADFEAFMAEKNCTGGIKYFNVQCCDADPGSTIEILAVYLITPDGEEVQQTLGGDCWGGGAYTATEIADGDEPEQPGEPGDDNVLFEGEQELSWWDPCVKIMPADFPLLTEGRTINVTFSAVDPEQEAPCFKMQALNADWSQTWLPGLAYVEGSEVAEPTEDNPAGDVHVPVAEPTTVSMTITAADVEVINAEGVQCIMIVGQGLTVSEVTVTSNGGITSTIAAPVQDNRIFNIWGVQVDENYKGIVISNGKKYIQR